MAMLTPDSSLAPLDTPVPETHGPAQRPSRTPARSVRDTFTMLVGDHGSMARNVKVMLFTVDLTADALRAWLPPGLKPPPRPRAHFWIGDYEKHASGVAYREAAIMVEAQRHGRIVSHCPWAVVDDEAPLIWGRDMMGYPKKMGTIDITRDGDAFEVEVLRRGERLWHITGEVDSATDLDVRNFPMPTEVINVWGIPFTPAILIKYNNTHDMKYLHPISANLEISGGTYDPLESLNVTNVQAVTGHAFRTDLVLPQATRLPYWLWGMVGIMRPIGFTSPMWLLRHYLFRSL
jgi:acetoacetate decarboxylase